MKPSPPAGVRPHGHHGSLRTGATLLLFLMLPACATGTSTRGPGPGAGAAADVRPAHPADVRFIQAMLHHHAQALEMTALAEGRAGTDEIRLLAQRIDISQRDEIAMMEQWLASRGVGIADQHQLGAAPMPGMLSAAQMEALSSVAGEAFDRLFLELMIHHHQGAVEMVTELMATPGAVQNANIYQIAAHVDSDQRVEIARMSRLLTQRR